MYNQFFSYALIFICFTTFKQISEDFSFLFIINEEIIVLICFIAFVIFSYRNLNESFISMLSDRKNGCMQPLKDSLGQLQSDLELSIKEIESITLGKDSVDMIKKSVVSGNNSLLSCKQSIFTHRTQIVLSQQARSLLHSCYRIKTSNLDIFRTCLESFFAKRPALNKKSINK